MKQPKERPFNKYMQTDCFAFCRTDSGCACRILDDIYCGDNKVCNFYKTTREEARQRKAAKEKFEKSLKV